MVVLTSRYNQLNNCVVNDTDSKPITLRVTMTTTITKSNSKPTSMTSEHVHDYQ